MDNETFEWVVLDTVSPEAPRIWQFLARPEAIAKQVELRLLGQTPIPDVLRYEFTFVDGVKQYKHTKIEVER